MTHSKLSADKPLQKAVRAILLTFAIAGVASILTSAPAHADWADQMGEGSGVDRGVMLAPAASGGSSQQNMDTAALREAMANSLTSDLADTLGAGGAMPAAYQVTGVVIPSIAANDGDDGLGELG